VQRAIHKTRARDTPSWAEKVAMPEELKQGIPRVPRDGQ
jgi:hypothetical protein